MPLDEPLSPEFQISNFLAKLYTKNYYMEKNQKVVSGKLSGHNFSGLGHARRLALTSELLHFEIPLHNFTSMSTISRNCRTIHQVVTENSSRQKFGLKEKKGRRRRIRNGAKTIKVRKRTKIRNQNNQAHHLTQVTNGKVTTSQLGITNESQEVSPFQASRWLQGTKK